ncbi:MAG: DUF2357 domain-containing protein [Chloroflexi bacterium]|nr:DUF2357 domain-containing protein [Chloroflexota bacterium]MBN9396906.1 DUF2357 domain-containing protein [Candidatus Melainabacteria bacterium]OJV90356.1 MAG: hypothetical protein BGO39_18065 [Chloroflexi bacterium 54-19]
MDSPLISEKNIQFFDMGGALLAGPAEWLPALMVIPVPLGLWEQVEVRLQDRPVTLSIRKINGVSRILAEWPRSGPGNYLVTYRQGMTIHEQLVTIFPQKISQEAFRIMLDDLQNKLPGAIALALKALGGLSGVKLLPAGESSFAQELQRLKRAILGTPDNLGLVQILPSLAKNPHKNLINREVWAKSEMARAPHPVRLFQAIQNDKNLDNLKRPMQVLDTRHEHTYDVYENQLLKTYYQEVFQRLYRLKTALLKANISDLYTEANKLLAHLVRAKQTAVFLDEVSLPDFVPSKITMVLLKTPIYQAILKGYLELHRNAAIRLESQLLEAPLENFPYLYQMWGTLQVILVLLEEAALEGFTLEEQRLFKRDVTGYYLQVLPDNYPVITLVHPVSNNRIKVTPERTFSVSGSIVSFTFPQRPDITIEVNRPGAVPKIYIFDPKYKLDTENTNFSQPVIKPKKEDIDKMHAYRDAIRTSSGERVVEYAAILYPGPSVSYKSGVNLQRQVEAIQALPGQEDTFITNIKYIISEILIYAE